MYRVCLLTLLMKNSSPSVSRFWTFFLVFTCPCLCLRELLISKHKSLSRYLHMVHSHDHRWFSPTNTCILIYVVIVYCAHLDCRLSGSGCVSNIRRPCSESGKTCEWTKCGLTFGVRRIQTRWDQEDLITVPLLFGQQSCCQTGLSSRLFVLRHQVAFSSKSDVVLKVFFCPIC